LKFWRYLNVEGTDYARIYVSHNQTNWVLIWENPESGIFDDQWTPVIFDISQHAAGQGSVYIKFTMGPSDEAGSYSGWNIDDLEVSSNPVYPAEGTMGTEFSIEGSGFGTTKGKVLMGNASLKNRSLTILAWNNGLIRSRLTGTTFPPGVYDVTLVPNGSPPIIHKGAFVVKSPEISSIERADGTAGGHITIHGKFFGTSKGKVYLEYEEGEGSVRLRSLGISPKRTNCQILSWTMDPATEKGDIVFVVPQRLDPGVYDLIVTNSAKSDSDVFTIKE
jgi:hypothetical protein